MNKSTMAHTFNFYMPDEHFKAVAKLAKAQRTSMASIVRLALTQHLVKCKAINNPIKEMITNPVKSSDIFEEYSPEED